MSVPPTVLQGREANPCPDHDPVTQDGVPQWSADMRCGAVYRGSGDSAETVFLFL